LPEATKSTTAVFVGTTMGESAGFEAAAEGAPFDIEESAGCSLTNAVAASQELGGPRRTYATACAAGNYAIGAAAAAVRGSRVRAALAGGVEPFSRSAMLGFARMRAMTPDLCRPFDAHRRGMQLGEAAAFVVLERHEDALARGARSLAEIGGFGISGDAFHPTAPRQDGSGMAAAMVASLVNGGLDPADVDWICAHGTGTQRSDEAEARAIRTVFGGGGPPVSSLKGALGHTLGAATAVEAVMSVMALRNGVIPGNATTETVDGSLEIDVVVEARRAGRLRWVMNCGYGFGGLNSALLIGASP
jgi:3-oxoacyl-[acyl-carrier-protein] synthase II